MFEATLSDDSWGDEDFTCNQCHVIFTSRKGASEHAETKHNVRRLLIKDRAQVRVEVESEDNSEVIENIDVNMSSEGEYFEFVKEELSEEIKTEDVKMEETFDVNTSEEVKDIKTESKGEGNVTEKQSGILENGEYIEEDKPEIKFAPPPKKPKIVLVKAKPEIPDEEENEERGMPGLTTSGEDAQNGSYEMDRILHVPQGTASVMDVHAAVDPIVLGGIVSSFGDQGSPEYPDSDTGSEPEKYDRRTQLNEHYREKLGFDQEEDDEEEQKEASFLLYFASFYFIINHSGGNNSRHVHQQ